MQNKTESENFPELQLNNAHCELIHTCFIFQHDYARLINMEHVVNNMFATNMGWV